MKKLLSGKRIVLSICCIVISLVGCVSAMDKNKIPVTTTSDEARALYNEGIDLFDSGQFSVAIKKFDQAIAKDSNFGMAYLMSALVWRFDYNCTKRDELIEKAVKTTNLSEVETLVIQFYKASFSRERPKQKEIIDKLTAMHPDNATVLLSTGIYLLNSGKYDKSIEVLKQAVEQHPTYQNFTLLGFSYYSSKNYDNALLNFNKAVKIAPDTPFALRGLGFTFKALKKFDKSINAFDKALKQNPNYVPALSGLGDVYLLTDKPEQARKNYQKMLETASNNYQLNSAHQQMAAYYVYKNQFDRVYDEWKKATDVFETDGDVETLWAMYRRRGHVCLQLGKFNDAKRVYNKWIELVKKSEKSDDFKNKQESGYYRYMIDIAIQQNDIQQAKELEQKFLKLDVKNITETKDYSAIKAAIATAEGQWDDAIASLGKFQIDYDEHYLKWARMYRDKGDTQKAKEYYQKVLDFGHDPLFWRLLCKKQAREELAKL